MIDTIVQWAVPVICSAIAGGCLKAIKSLYKRENALENGMQSLLRAEIIRSHEKYTKRDCCPVYAKEALTRAYKAYHDLGGNDVATSLYNEIMDLQTEK